MSPRAQQLAIAVWMGTHTVSYQKKSWSPKLEPEEMMVIKDRNGRVSNEWKYASLTDNDYEDPEDYLGDLNAIHKAEKVLTLRQREQYADALDKIGILTDDMTIDWDDVFQVAHATAAQRSEALLKTLNLWDPTK